MMPMPTPRTIAITTRTASMTKGVAMENYHFLGIRPGHDVRSGYGRQHLH